MPRPAGTPERKSVVQDLINGNNESETKKKKYVVNVYFDAELEQQIKRKADQESRSVSSYIQNLVKQDLAK